MTSDIFDLRIFNIYYNSLPLMRRFSCDEFLKDFNKKSIEDFLLHMQNKKNRKGFVSDIYKKLFAVFNFEKYYGLHYDNDEAINCFAWKMYKAIEEEYENNMMVIATLGEIKLQKIDDVYLLMKSRKKLWQSLRQKQQSDCGRSVEKQIQFIFNKFGIPIGKNNTKKGELWGIQTKNKTITLDIKNTTKERGNDNEADIHIYFSKCDCSLKRFKEFADKKQILAVANDEFRNKAQLKLNEKGINLKIYNLDECISEIKQKYF